MDHVSSAADAATVRCLIRRDGRSEELPLDRFSEIDQLRAQPGTIIWLQLRNPGEEQLRLLADEFDIHPLAMEDVRKRQQRPKLDVYADQHVLVVYEAIPTRGQRAGIGLTELHAFGGSNWIATVTWADSAAVETATLHFIGEGRFARPITVASALYAVFDAAVDSYFPVMDAIAERMDGVEDRILGGDGGRDSLREILAIKRELLEFRRVAAPVRDAANMLLRRDVDVGDEDALPYFQDLYDHLVRVLDQIDLYRDLLASILDARLTVASNSLNAVMKRLTAITVILMAPTLIAGIYGMNFDHMPELGWPLGYPFSLGLMLAVMVGAFAYFRARDWF